MKQKTNVVIYGVFSLSLVLLVKEKHILHYTQCVLSLLISVSVIYGTLCVFLFMVSVCLFEIFNIVHFIYVHVYDRMVISFHHSCLISLFKYYI